MKKIILLLTVSVYILYAWENYELKLFEKVFPLIFNKDQIAIYMQPKYQYIFNKKSRVITISSRCEDADILFIDNDKELSSGCKEKPYFLTSYDQFKENDHAIGVFYWKKGRPQLLFSKKRVQKYNLQLPAILEKYAY